MNTTCQNMSRDTACFFAGVGIGAGLMYILDPQLGRRRRSMMRDQARHLMDETRDGMRTVATDLRNRAQGLAAEARSAMQGEGHGFPRKRLDLFNDNWSPATRALVGAVGAGLVAYGLTMRFPWACVTGTVGLGLLASGATNRGVRDLIPESMHPDHLLGDETREQLRHAADAARQTVSRVRETVGV
jgi:hypothetical protein